LQHSQDTKVALVTGAGSGIGRAVSLALAQHGYALVLAGRRAEALEAVAAAIAAQGGRARALAADLTDESAVHRLFELTAREFGRLDLLFNNAGARAREVPLEELSAAEWRSVIDVNLTAAFLCAQQAVLLMKRQTPRGGRIINNGSVAAQVPRPHSAPYVASKHAITGLTKSIALDGRDHDIACGQIDIGNVATGFRPLQGQGSLQPDGSMREEPNMEMDSVVRAVIYMASLPLDANVLSMTVMATRMPLVGRG
jgi:NAD(P)-dependent dehydrogenase (short-subunit alcohol dehydrogenase family)